MNEAMPRLSERRQAVLKAIVQEHVASTRPVASETIARRYALGVSPATIRNEMAALEEMGYIHQLHTSAGRVPAEAGYRYYVEHLMEELSLTAHEQRTIDHQFHQANLELGHWLRLAVAVLAQSVHNAAVVTAPRGPQTRFKHVELISIQDALALLVLVCDGGIVQQQMFAPVTPATQDELSLIAARLNHLMAGQALEVVEQTTVPQSGPIDTQALDLVTRMMRDVAAEASAEVFVDGLDQILSQPEFLVGPRNAHGDGAAALQMVQLMQQGLWFKEMIHQVSDVEGLQIIIGGLDHPAEVRQISLVLSRYGSPSMGGLLGVLGPTRMHYGRAVSVVRYVGGILGEMASELGGHGAQ